MRHFILLCSHLSFIEWLHNHLIPCPFKYLTGYDCPGCGFQRSVLALLQGNLKASLHLYPATIPMLLVTAYTIIDALYPFDSKAYVRKGLYIATAAIIIVSYVCKMWALIRF